MLEGFPMPAGTDSGYASCQLQHRQQETGANGKNRRSAWAASASDRFRSPCMPAIFALTIVAAAVQRGSSGLFGKASRFLGFSHRPYPVADFLSAHAWAKRARARLPIRACFRSSALASVRKLTPRSNAPMTFAVLPRIRATWGHCPFFRTAPSASRAVRRLVEAARNRRILRCAWVELRQVQSACPGENVCAGPLLALLHQQRCAARQRRLLAKSFAPPHVPGPQELTRRGDLAGIIDHQGLAHFAAPSKPGGTQPVRWINRGLTQQMLKQLRPPKVRHNFGSLQKSLSLSGLCRLT